MSERRPLGVPWEDWTSRLIRKAQEEGAFDNLSAAGKPLPDLDKPYDELWWAKKLIEREKIDALPEALKLRREVERAMEKIWTLKTEAEVRTEIEAINERIRKVNASAVSGPPSNVIPLDAAGIIARWRER